MKALKQDSNNYNTEVDEKVSRLIVKTFFVLLLIGIFQLFYYILFSCLFNLKPISYLQSMFVLSFLSVVKYLIKKYIW